MQHNRTKAFIYILLALCCQTGTASAEGQARQSKTQSPVAEARAQIARGNLEEAERSLWTLLSTDPGNSEALTLLGIIRGRQKRYPEAEALLRRVIQLEPASLIAHRNLASALIAQNRPEEAIAEYEQVAKLAPSDTSATVELARLYVSTGRFSEALSTLKRVPSGRLPVEAVPVQAAALLGTGDKPKAVALIARTKQSPAAASELAEVFLDAHAPDYALQAIDSALTQSPHAPAHLYYVKGRALQAMGNLPGASTNFSRALTLEPKSVDTLLAMAAVNASQGKHGDALKFLKRAYTLQADSVEVLRAVVVESTQAGDRNLALQAADSLARKSDNADDLYLVGAARLEGREFAEASSALQKYVEQRPSDAKAFLGLGIAELAQQHYDEAKKALSQSVQIDPNLAEAEYQMGVAAEQQGVTEEAVQHYQRSVQLQPNHARALAGLGGEYLQAGDIDKAHSYLVSSLAADPQNYKAEYNLALVLAKLGHTAEAKQHMERSHQLKDAEDADKNGVVKP